MYLPAQSRTTSSALSMEGQTKATSLPEFQIIPASLTLKYFRKEGESQGYQVQSVFQVSIKMLQFTWDKSSEIGDQRVCFFRACHRKGCQLSKCNWPRTFYWPALSSPTATNVVQTTKNYLQYIPPGRKKLPIYRWEH